MSKRIDGLVLAMSPICNWKQELERLFSNILTKEEMRELLSFALCSPTGKNKFSNCFFSALQCYLIWMTVALSLYVNGVYFSQIVHFSMSYKPTWKTKRLKLSSESLSVFCFSHLFTSWIVFWILFSQSFYGEMKFIVFAENFHIPLKSVWLRGNYELLHRQWLTWEINELKWLITISAVCKLECLTKLDVVA